METQILIKMRGLLASEIILENNDVKSIRNPNPVINIWIDENGTYKDIMKLLESRCNRHFVPIDVDIFDYIKEHKGIKDGDFLSFEIHEPPI